MLLNRIGSVTERIEQSLSAYDRNTILIGTQRIRATPHEKAKLLISIAFAKYDLGDLFAALGLESNRMINTWLTMHLLEGFDTNRNSKLGLHRIDCRSLLPNNTTDVRLITVERDCIGSCEVNRKRNGIDHA